MFGEGASTGAAARRQKARAEMHASILDVAGRMIKEHGLDSVTIRGIANELGYSPGAIYEYFESKEAILKHVFFEGSGGLAEIMTTAIAQADPEASAAQMVVMLARTYRQSALENPEMYRLVLGEMKCPPAELVLDRSGGLPPSLGVVADVLVRGMESGEFRRQDPVAAIMGAWSVVQGFVGLELTGHLDVVELAMHSYGYQTPDTRAALFDRVLDSVLHGMLAR